MLNKELLLNPKEEFCLIKFINLPEGTSLENVPENFLQIKKGLCLKDIGLGGLNFPVTSSYWIPGYIGTYYTSAGVHEYFYPYTPVVEDIEVRVSWIRVYPAGSTVDFSITISPTTWKTGFDKNIYAYGYEGYDYHVGSSMGAITSLGIELNKRDSLFYTEDTPWGYSEFYCELYIDSTKGKGFRYGSKVVKFSPQISFPNANLTLEGVTVNNRGSDIYIAYSRSMSKVGGYLRWSSGNTYKISILTV